MSYSDLDLDLRIDPECYLITDIEVEFGIRPNDDIYTADIPESFTVKASELNLNEAVIEYLENTIQFDTPDEPVFEIKEVSFKSAKL